MGHTVDLRGDDRVGDRLREVGLLHRVGHRAVAREQEPGAHGDTARPIGERGDEAPAVEEPAGGDDRDVEHVDHLGQQQRRRHLARVTAALAPLYEHRVDAPCRHLLRVALGADRRDDQHASVLEPPDEVFPRRLCEGRDLHAFLDDQVDAVDDVGLIGSHVHPEGLVGPLLHLGDRVT
jgi:hypothetical protein